MTEDELGPEPFDPDPGNHATLDAWTLWCAKCTALRFSGLKDAVEIWVFHVACKEVRDLDGDEEATTFFMEAFLPNTEARAAALRPLSPLYIEQDPDC